MQISLVFRKLKSEGIKCLELLQNFWEWPWDLIIVGHCRSIAETWATFSSKPSKIFMACKRIVLCIRFQDAWSILLLTMKIKINKIQWNCENPGTCNTFKMSFSFRIKSFWRYYNFLDSNSTYTQGKMNFPISSILETYLRIPKVCSNFELIEEFSANKNHDPKNLQYFWNGPDIFRFVHFSGTVDFCDPPIVLIQKTSQ